MPTPNLDKHRQNIKVLEDLLRLDETLDSLERDALQYFIGMGERMTKENIEQVLGKIEMPIDESWCELKETSNPAVVILKNKWTGMIIQAILTSLTGEGR